MAQDKYISIGQSVSGFSFANLGLFTGFADGIYKAVYSLVILEIFRSSAIVGIYVAAYSAFCMVVALFANELFRRFSKVRVFNYALIGVIACYAMMAFSVQPNTFVALDWTSGIGTTLIGILIPLFMADFATRDVPMARLNSRYYLWVNIGAFFAPVFAMYLAEIFGNRSAFFASACVYLACMFFFKYLQIVQEDKRITPVNPRTTFRALRRNAMAFFRRPGMLRAYIINFSFFSLSAMRALYVPIVVIEAGFSKQTLGYVLTLGIIPYILLSGFMGRLVRRFGKKLWLILGFGTFALISAYATVASGYPLLACFVLWQISGAFMESVHDLLFFDNTVPSERSRFYGVFRTSVNLPKIIAPITGALVIAVFGTTVAVWGITAFVAVMATLILFSAKK